MIYEDIERCFIHLNIEDPGLVSYLNRQTMCWLESNLIKRYYSYKIADFNSLQSVMEDIYEV